MWEGATVQKKRPHTCRAGSGASGAARSTRPMGLRHGCWLFQRSRTIRDGQGGMLLTGEETYSKMHPILCIFLSGIAARLSLQPGFTCAAKSWAA